ncbi:MAG: hypothetical protein AVDCRST_MAG12-2426, partial [uncultured Rubrobacteraceae bacterium]
VPGFLRSAGPHAQAAGVQRQGRRASAVRPQRGQTLAARQARPTTLHPGGGRRTGGDVARGLGAARSEKAI